MDGIRAKHGHVLYAQWQNELCMVLDEKTWKVGAEVFGLNQYTDNDLLIHRRLLLPSPLIYHKLFTVKVSCLKSIQLYSFTSSLPTKPTKANRVFPSVMWPSSSILAVTIKKKKSSRLHNSHILQYMLKTVRDLSCKDKISLLVKQTNKLLKEKTPPLHTWIMLCDANLRSFPLTHFLKQNSSFLKHKFFRLLLPRFIS